MENRFKRLRYKDDLCFHEELTMSKLAEEMGVSKATIHNIESSDEYDAKTSILKLYHKRFPDISFDYLLGVQNTKERLGNHFEEVLPFGNDFYTKLESLMKRCEYYKEADRMMGIDSYIEDEIPSFLEALISDPDDLIISFSELYRAIMIVRQYTEFEPELACTYEHLGAEMIVSQLCKDFVLHHIMPYLTPKMDELIRQKMDAEKPSSTNTNEDGFLIIPDTSDKSDFD